MEWFTEPFQLGLQLRALLGGVIAGVMCAPVGTWLVLRGMSFFGDAFMHGIVPGIALAVVTDAPAMVGAAVAAMVMVAGIELVSRHTTLRDDTAIGLLFVGMLALGVVVLSATDAYTGNLTAILFGDALGITRGDLVVQAVLTLLVAVAVWGLHRPLLALTFGAERAEALGMRPRLTHALLLALVAAAVIGSYQAVGTLLVFGLLVGPPATAALVARTVHGMMLTAAGVSVASVWAGLVLSYHLSTAGSATMGLVPIVVFFLVLALTRLRRPQHRRDQRVPVRDLVEAKPQVQP